MAQSSTYRRFRRRIGQITRRVRQGPQLQPRQLSVEVMEILGDLRRAASSEPEIAIELALSLLETLPEIFTSLDDRLGLLGAALDNVPVLVVDLMHDDMVRPTSAIDRGEVFERLFELWVGDDSGYLDGLGEAILGIITGGADEECVAAIAKRCLRDMPLVFPAAGNETLDVRRSILLDDRYRIDHLLGELQARHDRHDLAITVAEQRMRFTGDAVDYVRALSRAAREDEAIEVCRRALRNPASPRPAAIRAIFEEIVNRREGTARVRGQACDDFLAAPTFEGFQALQRSIPVPSWDRIRDDVLTTLEKSEEATDLCFMLYIDQEMVVEADGLAVNRKVDANVLAKGALEVIDVHPSRAAGWLLIAARRLIAKSRVPGYEQATEWLQMVRRAADVTGQQDAFERTMRELRVDYRRRRALIAIFDRQGL